MSNLRRMSAGVVIATVLASGTAFAADPESCRAVTFSDVGWTDITATTAAASVILEGLGYEPEVQVLSVPVTYASLKKGDVDVFLGNWMPSMAADVQPYLDDGSVESIAQNLEGAGYGLVVPGYVAEAGVTSLKNVGQHPEKFDRKIYGIEPGNDGNRIVLEMIEDPENGLDGFELVESSEAGMISQAERAIRSEDWIVFLGWTPHPIMGAMDIVYLDGMGDSGFGAATVHTNVRSGLTEECPNLGHLLKNLIFSLEMENKIMGAILDESQEPQAAATAWLKQNPEVLEHWLEGVTAFGGEEGLPAVRSHLDL